MAVTKIRKISSWVLILCTVISLVVIGLFFFGGDEELYKGELWNPTYTGLFLNWIYILFAITFVAIVLFGIWQFISSFKSNPKGGLIGLVVIVLFVGLLFLTYTFGDTTPLNIMNAEAQEYNTPFWLKMSDMWLYSTYILTFFVILAIFIGSIKRIMGK